MTLSIPDLPRKELLSRGFSATLTSPNDTMVLDELCSTSAELADLLEVMVARREKVFRSIDVVGAGLAKRSYDDVVLVVDDIKAVIGQLSVA